LTAQTERKYALTKVAAGDYLLPSNDGRTIWRVVRYEDGPSHGLADWPRDRVVWAAYRWAGPDSEPFVDTSPDAWGRWKPSHDGCATRAEAIRWALA
jgi:hypothetical protein